MANMTPDPVLDAYLDGRYGTPGQGSVAPGYVRNPIMDVALVPAPMTPPAPIDYETSVLCAPNGDRIIVVTAIDPTNGLPTSIGYTMAGAVFSSTPLSQLTACDSIDLESDPTTMCEVNSSTTFMRWFVKRDGVILNSFNTKIDGTPYFPVGPVSIGECKIATISAPVVADGLNIANGTLLAEWSPTNVTGWTYTGGFKLQSVTVTVLRSGTPSSGNIVTVSFSSGNSLTMVEGQTQEWSVAQDSANVSEFLFSSISVNAQGNSAATVTWTEQQ